LITKTLVKSFYNGLLVTCYELDGKKYVSNQHGNWDIYEGQYAREEKAGTVMKDDDEIKNIIAAYKKQSGEK